MKTLYIDQHGQQLLKGSWAINPIHNLTLQVNDEGGTTPIKAILLDRTGGDPPLATASDPTEVTVAIYEDGYWNTPLIEFSLSEYVVDGYVGDVSLWSERLETRMAGASHLNCTIFIHGFACKVTLLKSTEEVVEEVAAFRLAEYTFRGIDLDTNALHGISRNDDYDMHVLGMRVLITDVTLGVGSPVEANIEYGGGIALDDFNDTIDGALVSGKVRVAEYSASQNLDNANYIMIEVSGSATTGKTADVTIYGWEELV
jgi:hypothetical protein